MKSSFINHSFAVFIGVVAGLLTLFVIPSQFEIFVWVLLVLIIVVYSLHQFGSQKRRNILVISFLTGMAITLTHLYFIDQYLETHQEEIQALDKILINNSYRLTLLIIAPIYWVILGALATVNMVLIEKIINPIKSNR